MFYLWPMMGDVVFINNVFEDISSINSLLEFSNSRADDVLVYPKGIFVKNTFERVNIYDAQFTIMNFAPYMDHA